jgi:hypothetical protein
VAFCLYPAGRYGLRLFSTSPFAGGQHLLEICGQSQHQSSQIDSQAQQCLAGTGLAIVCPEVSKNPSEDRYTYRVFCTNLKGKPHKIIANYDKRADAENLIGEGKREDLDAIPSAKFKNNYAYFQIVMLAYKIWRYYKILAQRSTQQVASEEPNLLEGIQDNTIRIARLKLLLIAAKLAFHNNREQVKFSIHDSRTPSMQRFLRFLDNARAKARPWIQQSLWPCRFSVNLL